MQTLYLIAYLLLLSSGLLILRLIVRRQYREHGHLTFIPATLQVLLFFVYGGFPALYLPADWPAVKVNLFQHILGLFLLFGGLTILCYGMVLLGIFRSIGGDKPALEQDGPYRFTRNPQALACGCYVFGFALLWPSCYAAGWAVLYAILIHAMILTEEEHLQRIHGPRYEAYCQQVPRYIRWGSANENASS